MTQKKLPCSPKRLQELTAIHPTPFHLYDEAGIRQTARQLKAAFAWNPGFREYFAVKATPNPFILRLLGTEGFGADCSSLPELILAERSGMTGDRIMFTSNDTPAEEFKAARELDAIINLDDLSHIPYLEAHAGIPKTICLRYNPGPLKGGNAIIGHPEEAKYGFTRDQLFEGYRMLRDKGARRFGLHTMVASNELDADYFVETASLLFELAIEISRELDLTFDFINLGGGIGIPYHPDDTAVDLQKVGAGIQSAYQSKLIDAGHPPLQLCLECGRMLTGPNGWLVAHVRHLKNTYKRFAGLDACMADLMRPAMYGAYHHISIPEKMDAAPALAYDVTGSLCENNDKFAINRDLPKLDPGDLVVIHDTGAHGHAMGFNYNGKLRAAELLQREDGSVATIRRAETVDDYFATLDFDALRVFVP